MNLLGIALLAAVISAVTTRLILITGLTARLLDIPNERSLHESPKPRIGGIGICLSIFVAVLVVLVGDFGPFAPLGYLAAGAFIVMLISFVDDIIAMNAGIRFLFHLAGAAAAVGGGLVLQDIQLIGYSIQMPHGIAVVFSLLFVVWLTNLYNFMDGMDGFAGGMTVVGFATMALMTAISGASDIAAISACLAGAGAGFLLFNFPPARVFMGDVGASTLGFFAGALSLWADIVGAVPLWISVLLFSPFIVDASITLVRRAWNRERLWHAHRNHYYQKLVRLGWGHRKTVLAEYALMLACAISAIVAWRLGTAGQLTMILLWVIVYTCMITLVHRMESQKASHESAKTA